MLFCVLLIVVAVLRWITIVRLSVYYSITKAGNKIGIQTKLTITKTEGIMLNMNQINRIKKLNKETCVSMAETLFAESNGIDVDRISEEAQKMGQVVYEQLDPKAVYSYYERVSFEGNRVFIADQVFACNGFERIDQGAVKGAYIYVVTAGELTLGADASIMEQLYFDLWATAFADAARMQLKEMLKGESNLSEGFGPGFYGMDVNQMQELTMLADISGIGMERKESNYLVPLKSCGGIWFEVTDRYTALDQACETCKGNTSGCRLCSVYTARTQPDKCTGICAQCGRCRGANMAGGVNGSKTKLFPFPEDFKPEQNQPGAGISFDMGTTTVAGTLWDRRKGKVLGSAVRTNPQRVHGADVIARIAFCDEEPEHLNLLRSEMMDCLNDIILELCETCHVDFKEIFRVVAAGNTTMAHIFAGHHLASLARSPFEPEYTGSIVMDGTEAGLKIAPGGQVFLVPNIAGHVGGDITAGIVASRVLQEQALTLFIDIGTNGEIVLVDGDAALTCSAAAGPAFEGAAIYQGMRAAPGAIEHIAFDEKTVVFTTVENTEPVGICGSGLIDAIAEMLGCGVIDETGRIASAAELEAKQPGSWLSKRLRDGEDGREFVLVFKSEGEDLVITQKDVREVQLAKGAIAAGIAILLREIGAAPKQIQKVMVAGAFGSFIDKESAIRIGLLPAIDPDRIVSIGNAAGTGALMLLAAPREVRLAEEIPQKVGHIELAVSQGFQEQYLAEMNFNFKEK